MAGVEMKRYVALTNVLVASSLLATSSLLTRSPLRADTVFLKDGNQILDCNVREETATQVSLHTPVGDMVVPKTAIHRIQRVKTNYDTYAERLASIREGNVDGLFKLATWCRTAIGLRTQSDELLAKVVSLKGDHADARRFLGHVKLGGEWIVPAPLSIRLKAGGPLANDLRADLGLFLKTRKDVCLSSETGSKSDAGDSLDVCTLDASVVITRKAPGAFFGTTVGWPTYCSTVLLQAKSSWIGNTLLKTAASGQVPGDGGNASLAVQNALGMSSMTLHKFLDQLTQLRARKLEEAFRKGDREAAASKA